MKTIAHILVVVVTGSLLGTFLGKLVHLWFPQGNAASLISTSINTGLNPVTVDLSVIQFTLGLVFKFDIMTVAGVFFAAMIYKQLVK
ncbi:MAG: DUF4321 domain-containing protein [Elusimicrobia bacterium]|nr:DUF4321 domain-containing protein [Elusimicrobiota bacterium]